MLTRISFALLCISVSICLFTVSYAQQSDHELYVGLYQLGEFDKAVTILKRISKQNPSDSEALYYLGLAYLRLEHEKDAVKAFEKAREIDSSSAKIRTALAYSYLLRNDARASNEAYAGLKIDDRLPLGHYVIAVSSLRDGIFNTAYERAKRAIELDPNFAAAYMVKSQSLVSSFAKQSGTVMRPVSSRSDLLTEAVGDLEKYVSLTPKLQNDEYYAKTLDSLRFFAQYYGRPENQRTIIGDTTGSTVGQITPLRIIYKPRAAYTDKARQALVSGTVVILAGFSEDGTVKHVMVIKSLGYGLDEAAVSAARGIKFEPKMINGKPVPVVKTIEYNFNIF